MQRGFHRRNGQGVARQRAANAAHIRIFEDKSFVEGLRHFLGEAIDRGGHASSEGLAKGQEIRLEAVRGGVSAGTGADGVSLVDDEIRPVFAGQFAQRVVIARRPGG